MTWFFRITAIGFFWVSSATMVESVPQMMEPYIPPTKPMALKDYVRMQATLYGIDPDFALSHAQLESGFDVHAVSPISGCRGLFQLLPSNAPYFCHTAQEKLTWMQSGEVQTLIYCRMMSFLLKKYNGDYDKALLEYGGGPKAVKKYGKSKKHPYLKKIHKHISMKKLKRALHSESVPGHF